MDYIKEISEKIIVIDEVLTELNTQPLFQNTDFIVDNMSFESWLKIDFNYIAKNQIPISLIFTPTNLEIRLDRISEAIDWSNKDFEKSITIIKSVMKKLFTSYILVEYYGRSKTEINLFDKEGKCTNHFMYREGFSFNQKKEKKLYSPLYNMATL